jgi:excisionase family DNA binding protein
MKILGPNWLSRSQAADVLGFSSPTVAQWIQARMLPARLDSGSGEWLIVKNDVLKFAQKHDIELTHATPRHYTPVALAKCAGLKPWKIRRLIAQKKIASFSVPIPGQQRKRVFVAHSEARRFITFQPLRKSVGAQP